MGPPLAQQLVHVASGAELLLRVPLHVDDLAVVLAVPAQLVVPLAAQLEPLPVAPG